MASLTLTPIQRLAVKYAAAGWGDRRIADELKISIGQVAKWRKNDPSFRAALQVASLHHTDLVEATLAEGEREAALTLIAALSSETHQGKPHWTVRIQAAQSLLDRAGTRGKAIERQQIAQGVVTTHLKGGTLPQGGVEEALRNALRDPGVRAWLKAEGKTELLTAETIIEEAVVSAQLVLEPPDEETPDQLDLFGDGTNG